MTTQNGSKIDEGLIIFAYDLPPGPDGRKSDHSLFNNEPIYSTCKSLERNQKTPKRESWDFIMETKNTADIADVTNNFFGSRSFRNDKVRLCEYDPDFFSDVEKSNDEYGTVSTLSEFILIPKSISSQETIQAWNDQNSSCPAVDGHHQPKINIYKKFAGYKDLYDNNQKLTRKNLMSEKGQSWSLDDRQNRRSIFLIVALLLICTFLVISAFLIKRLYFDDFQT